VTRQRPESEQDAKLRRILDAAHEVCARCGVEGARMDEVAALARVSKGTLYNFFESKRDLFLASMIDSYEESLQIIDTVDDGGAVGPRADLDRILEGMVRVLEAMAPRMTVHYQAWGVVAGNESARARLFGFLFDFFNQRSQAIVTAIRAGQEDGSFDGRVDADAVTDGIMAMLGGFLYRSAFDTAYSDPARLRACFDALVRNAFYVAPESEIAEVGHV
jgi:AcrR family transcriptional regulator